MKANQLHENDARCLEPHRYLTSTYGHVGEKYNRLMRESRLTEEKRGRGGFDQFISIYTRIS